MSKCIPSVDRDWTSTPLPDPHYNCPECDTETYASELFWLMVLEDDDTIDDWYCIDCIEKFNGGKSVESHDAAGISLADALAKVRAR